MLSRGSLYSLGTGARKGLVLFWTAMLLALLLTQYAAVVNPARTLAANDTGSQVMGGFEIDGDFPAATADDWANSANTGAGLVNGPTVQDPISADPTVLSNGVSDNDSLTDWQMNGTAQAPQKADIGNVYALNRVFSGNQWAYIGIERQSGQGTVQYDLEFNKLGNTTNSHGVSVPNRTTGDLLFTATQTGSGGWTINATVQHWTGTWDSGSWSSPTSISSSLFYGLANQYKASHPSSWSDALGSTVPSNQFAEMAMNVSTIASQFIGCPGYGTLNIRSISSEGGTPELKDVILPITLDLSTCGSLSWLKQDGLGDALGGATFTVTPNPATGTGSIDVTDNQAPDQNATAGSFKLTDVIPGEYTVQEKSAPAGYQLDPTVQTVTVGEYQNASIDYVWKDPVIPAPALGLTKTDDLNPAKYDHVGQVVTYTLTATNNGNVTLHDVTVSDSPALDGFACVPALPVASLAVGDSVTCTGTHTITQADLNAGSFADTASATSTEADAPDASDIVYGSQPALNLEKQVSVNGGAYAHTGSANPGDTLTYRLTITNTGNADATGETVTDNLSGVLAHATWNASASASSGSPSFSDPNLTWSGISIAANGGTATLTFSVTLDQTGWAAGSTDLPNVAVEANSGNCPTATSENPDCSTNTTVTTGTSLGITKSVDPSTITGDASTDVSYTIVVSNSGSGDTTGNVLVTDNDFPTFYSISGVTCTPTNATCDATHLNGTGIDLGTIAAGASVTITVSGTASPNNTSDLGDHVNTANACEQVVEGQPVCVSAQATLTVTLSHNPAIHIVKTPSTTVTPTGGGPVTYTYVVTNTGNVPLSNVTVTDNKCSSVTYVDGDTSDNGLLDLTETWTFTCTTTLTATTTNIGTANGYDGDTKVSDSDTATVTVPVVPPPPPPNPPTPTPTPTPSGTVLPTATAQLTLPPTSTLDGSSPSSQSGNGLLLILGAVGLVMLLLGLIAPAPARARQRSRRR